ncbi:hypothetical protein U9M48_010019 [Paspalum notatum var. saurae]|uniref:E3 ubiquitin-protein ligase Sina-like RING finger domain-containing protein n=1 Tax=Paspalum notatum var. saurae TaxID=547442 RepID=A0AAQ3WG30_PASNO
MREVVPAPACPLKERAKAQGPRPERAHSPATARSGSFQRPLKLSDQRSAAARCGARSRSTDRGDADEAATTQTQQCIKQYPLVCASDIKQASILQVMEPKWGTKVEGVRMAMRALECPMCYDPLVPPIYQCGVGHLICNSCRVSLKKCLLCPRTAFERCFGMEHVVESIEVPCGFAKYGCTKKMAYFAPLWQRSTPQFRGANLRTAAKEEKAESIHG